MAEPAISIIVPCYNAAGTLRSTLLSLREQIFRDWEVLCADDGSTDETLDVLAALARQDPRIRRPRFEHAGAAACRNRALAFARADRVLFLDADDVLRPNALQLLFEAAQAADERTIIIGGFELLTQSGRPLGIVRFPRVPEFTVDAFLAHDRMPPGMLALLPRDLLGDRPFDETLPASEDYDLWLRLADRRPTGCITVPQVLLGYRLRAGSLSHTWGDRRFQACKTLFERWSPRAANPANVRDALHRRACEAASIALAKGDADALQRYFAELPPLAPTTGFAACVAYGLHWAFLFVHGARGRTWRHDRAVWMGFIEPWLQQGPLSAYADEIINALRALVPEPVDRLDALRCWLARRPDARQLVIYGLGSNGLALLHALRDEGPAGVELAVADDHLDEETLAMIGLPSAAPRTWQRWPDGAAVIVTPGASAALVRRLEQRGGEAGRDFICMHDLLPSQLADRQTPEPVLL